MMPERPMKHGMFKLVACLVMLLYYIQPLTVKGVQPRALENVFCDGPRICGLPNPNECSALRFKDDFKPNTVPFVDENDFVREKFSHWEATLTISCSEVRGEYEFNQQFSGFLFCYHRERPVSIEGNVTNPECGWLNKTGKDNTSVFGGWRYTPQAFPDSRLLYQSIPLPSPPYAQTPSPKTPGFEFATAIISILAGAAIGSRKNK